MTDTQLARRVDMPGKIAPLEICPRLERGGTETAHDAGATVPAAPASAWPVGEP